MKAVGKVYMTNNYELFKKLDGNRDVTDERVRKIISSVKNVGQCMCPILVNEKYEVIDGQARVEAFKRLELPVYYVVMQGVGIEECISLNINLKNWNIDDHIKSKADIGIVDYQYLLNLCKAYEKQLGLPTILAALKDVYGASGWHYSAIREGAFSCTQKQYEDAVDKLEWLMKFVQGFQRFTVSRRPYYFALLFCWRCDEVDNDLMFLRVTAQRDLYPASNTIGALETLERIYNYRNKHKVYIATEYKKREKI